MLKVTLIEANEEFVLISTYEGIFKLFFDGVGETYAYK